MLVLKLIEKNFYGYDHPEGVVDKVAYHKISEELTVIELEEKLKEKLKEKVNVNNQYCKITWEIIQVTEWEKD